MKSAREETLERVAQFGEEATIEEILRELYFQAQVTRGLEQFERGETLSTEEAMKRLDRWLNYDGR